ncbi:MAG: nuclear transport factor 2 family protein [Chitinophagaceae bacterium]
MRYIFIIALFLFATIAASAQKDTAAVLAAVTKLEKALINKDSASVNALLHKDVAYGHSSGWVQNKKNVVDDMMSGFLVYQKIEQTAVSIDAGKEKAIVQERVSASGVEMVKRLS